MEENLKVKKFKEWIENARPGKFYIYHTGFLTIDRGRIVDSGDARTDVFVPVEPVHSLGEAAIEAFDAKRVHLFQRKLHDGVYEYIAVKRSPYGRQW